MTKTTGIPAPGYRLPAATRIGVVRLQVADLARSIDYYTRVLGLRVLSQVDGIATLGTQGVPSALIELHTRPGVRPVPRRGLLGLYHFAILVPDRAALGRFVAHLEDLHVRVGAADHLVSEALYLSDPDGLGIEVYADRPRSEWRTNGGEIAMATDPLDLSSLLRAAGGQPWTGMPEGTVIGHVHFSVDAIAAAEAFYHSALGLDKTVWSYPGALFLSAGGYHHHLGTNIWSAGAPVASDDDARLQEWELVLPSVSDVRAAAAQLAAGGHRVTEAGGDRLLTDPWGITLRLTAAMLNGEV